MIRHIFIAPINEGVTEEKVNERVSSIRLLSEQVPEIIQLTVGEIWGYMIQVMQLLCWQILKIGKAGMRL